MSKNYAVLCVCLSMWVACVSLVWLAGIQTAVTGQECLPDNMKCGKLYVMYIVIAGTKQNEKILICQGMWEIQIL